MPSGAHYEVNVVWTVGACLTGCLSTEGRRRDVRQWPAGFFVLLQPSGVLLLRGELDLATVQDLQDSIDEILVPGKPISSSIWLNLRSWRRAPSIA
jgi:hypothetical protein